MPSVETVWIQGQGFCNEDRLIIDQSRGLYGVADGATGLDRFRDENGLTGGAIAAEIVAEHFLNLESETDLFQATLQANERLRQVMRDQGIDLQKTETLWAAAHAVVRIGEHHIEWVQSGDCMIYALYRDQTVRTVTRDSVEDHDRQVIELWIYTSSCASSSLNKSLKRINFPVIPIGNLQPLFIRIHLCYKAAELTLWRKASLKRCTIRIRKFSSCFPRDLYNKRDFFYEGDGKDDDHLHEKT
ncbi:protein phosphatase 2C domain-containing protein [Polycladomyces subterraneus]|uniref:Protein phosphatase 2C domain-containing protein n=1 Tax=Polycladomyces subterraneus TaxID=1016997 RepID=A0ABT8IJR2_9BACL|nr:protein phosphatase 2C domain-containing protein [Polycladomyces subterraneus]MDN4593028.1 protein phosphatase 2C domain-containing protein [Polycladomyces subterraneus]